MLAIVLYKNVVNHNYECSPQLDSNYDQPRGLVVRVSGY
jgi:hypothetical protein